MTHLFLRQKKLTSQVGLPIVQKRGGHLTCTGHRIQCRAPYSAPCAEQISNFRKRVILKDLRHLTKIIGKIAANRYSFRAIFALCCALQGSFMNKLLALLLSLQGGA